MLESSGSNSNPVVIFLTPGNFSDTSFFDFGKLLEGSVSKSRLKLLIFSLLNGGSN